MSLKEKVIEVLRQPCPIEVGETTVGFYQMPEDEAVAIYERLVDAGLLVSDEPKYDVYEPVTDHYGIVIKRSIDNDVYCVFPVAANDKNAVHAVFGSLDRAKSERECRYLEAMNHGGSFNE